MNKEGTAMLARATILILAKHSNTVSLRVQNGRWGDKRVSRARGHESGGKKVGMTN